MTAAMIFGLVSLFAATMEYLARADLYKSQVWPRLGMMSWVLTGLQLLLASILFRVVDGRTTVELFFFVGLLMIGILTGVAMSARFIYTALRGVAPLTREFLLYYIAFWLFRGFGEFSSLYMALFLMSRISM